MIRLAPHTEASQPPTLRHSQPQPPKPHQVNPNSRCVHVTFIVGAAGLLAPRPSFYVLATDRPDEPLCGRSVTMAWEGVVERVRRAAPGAFAGSTALSGPLYSGLADPGGMEL